MQPNYNLYDEKNIHLYKYNQIIKHLKEVLNTKTNKKKPLSNVQQDH